MYSQKDRYPDSEWTIQLLKQLVREDTCQPSGNEDRLVSKILEMFDGKAEYEVLRHNEERATLILTIPGEKEDGAIVFAGHLDTVECGDDKKWTYPPLDAKIHEGSIYGRGAVDMKGGIAAMVMTAQYLLKHSIKLDRTVYFCFTADEERQGMGARALAGHSKLRRASEVIICEPTDEKIACCEKGALWLEIEATGLSAHASCPEAGENALEYVMELVRAVKSIVYDEGKSIHPYLGRPTCTLTKMSGGISENILPDKAYAVLDIRSVPGSRSHEKILKEACEIGKEMLKGHKNAKIEIRVLNNRPALQVDENEELVKRMTAVLKKNNKDISYKGMNFYTDASQLIPVWDIPFLIIGPGKERMAHCVDENIQIESVQNMTRIYLDYLLTYFGKEDNACLEDMKKAGESIKK